MQRFLAGLVGSLLLIAIVHATSAPGSAPFPGSGEVSGSYMGVGVQDVTRDRVAALKLKEERGAEIGRVDHDGPAEKAGLKEHDVILELNGIKVQGAEELRRLLHENPPGRIVQLLISRDGQPINISLQLAEKNQQVSSAPTEFIVLRTDRVDVPVGETTHLNCSVVGSGDAAQINCESQTSGCESETSGSGPYGSSPCKIGTGLGRGLGTRVSVYHVALVVGSNQVGYVVYCGGGGLLRKGCQPLSTGQVLKGSVKGDKLTASVDGKPRNYTVETSAYIGPLTARSPKSDSTASPPVEQPSTEPSVKLAVEKSRKSAESGPGRQADQPDSLANTARVMFSSEPSGADIYVDGEFMGNTPSQIQLPAGTHTVRIEAKGQRPWSRTVTLTAGGKVTLQAVLGADTETTGKQHPGASPPEP